MKVKQEWQSWRTTVNLPIRCIWQTPSLLNIRWTPDVSRVEPCNAGLFRANGGSGYVLKPPALRRGARVTMPPEEDRWSEKAEKPSVAVARFRPDALRTCTPISIRSKTKTARQ